MDLMDKLVEAKRNNGKTEYGTIVEVLRSYIVVKFLDGTVEDVKRGEYKVVG